MDQTPESIGMIASRPQPEIHPPQGPVVDPAYIVRFAQAHEQAGFDRVLVAWGSTAPDAIMVATHAAKATSRIGFMVAHRPDFIAPTLANRQFATLDQLSGGRAAIHVISGGSQTEQRKDGDFPVHDERYARTKEYVTLLKRFSLSMRPVLGDTEAAEWARTGRILAQMRALRSEGGGPAQSRPESVGSQRLLEAASAGRVRDKRLWTEVAAAIGAGHNSTALVGTPEQVAYALAEYRALGVTTLLIRSFDPIEDAAEYGGSLLPASRCAATGCYWSAPSRWPC